LRLFLCVDVQELEVVVENLDQLALLEVVRLRAGHVRFVAEESKHVVDAGLQSDVVLDAAREVVYHEPQIKALLFVLGIQVHALPYRVQFAAPVVLLVLSREQQLGVDYNVALLRKRLVVFGLQLFVLPRVGNHCQGRYLYQNLLLQLVQLPVLDVHLCETVLGLIKSA
jgi:hypothetical protein